MFETSQLFSVVSSLSEHSILICQPKGTERRWLRHYRGFSSLQRIVRYRTVAWLQDIHLVFKIAI